MQKGILAPPEQSALKVLLVLRGRRVLPAHRAPWELRALKDPQVHQVHKGASVRRDSKVFRGFREKREIPGNKGRSARRVHRGYLAFPGQKVIQA